MPKLAGARSPKANKGSEDEGGAGSAAATALAGAEATEHRCSIRRPHFHPPGELEHYSFFGNEFERSQTNAPTIDSSKNRLTRRRLGTRMTKEPLGSRADGGRPGGGSSQRFLWP